MAARIKSSPSHMFSTYMTKRSAINACICYASAASSVTIMNKIVFSHAKFHYPWFTLAFQNIISVLLITFSRLMGWTRSGLFSRSLSRSMTVPILFFVLFIFTNAQSLRYVNLPVLTVWKSLGPMFVTLFERVYFGDQFSIRVYLSMLLIVMSAFVTAINDLEYSAIGYAWAAMNVLANVAYLASLRIFLRDPEVSALDKTFHSNLLSIIPILPMSALSGELPKVFVALSTQSTWFITAYFLSGFLTTAVCASAFWTIALTNGSTLSFIGGLNKVPIILFSLFLFDMHISISGWVGVTLGVIAGIVFIKAKSFNAIPVMDDQDLYKVKLDQPIPLSSSAEKSLKDVATSNSLLMSRENSRAELSLTGLEPRLQKPSTFR